LTPRVASVARLARTRLPRLVKTAGAFAQDLDDLTRLLARL
jgi:hypothetical protein